MHNPSGNLGEYAVVDGVLTRIYEDTTNCHLTYDPTTKILSFYNSYSDGHYTACYNDLG